MIPYGTTLARRYTSDMSNVEVVLSILGVVCTAASVYVGLVVQPLKDSIKDLREDHEKRLDALHDDGKAEREKMERRLADMERTYVSRESLERAMKDLGERFERGVARIETSVKDMSSKVDHLAERVGKVESA